MKMVGSLLRWVCSSSSSAGLIRNQNLLCRAFSAATTAPELEESTRLTNINLQTEHSKSDGSENWELFKSWMLKHNKRYRSEEEMLYRFQIFSKRVKCVEKWNKESSGCTFGLNYFSDLKNNEVSRGHVPRRLLRPRRARHVRG